MGGGGEIVLHQSYKKLFIFQIKRFASKSMHLLFGYKQ